MTRKLKHMQSQAETDVLAERERQMYDEKYTPRFDDDVNPGREIALAAATYAYGAGYDDYTRKSMLNQDHAGRPTTVSTMWPWKFDGFKPTTARRDLVKAAALCIAEIERLDRAEAKAIRDEAERVENEARQEAEFNGGKCGCH